MNLGIFLYSVCGGFTSNEKRSEGISYCDVRYLKRPIMEVSSHKTQFFWERSEAGILLLIKTKDMRVF